MSEVNHPISIDDISGIWYLHPECPVYEGECIAHGGDLSPERLIFSYDHGIFPWFSYKLYKKPLWYAPKERFVIFPNEIHVSHSMRTLLNKHEHTVTFNTCFRKVMFACATVDDRYKNFRAWLGANIIVAYTKLYEMGRAMSVEVWHDEKLVGGLYGVLVGNGFVGESMFSREPNGSKIALIALAQRMQEEGKALIDCQHRTPHLESMGGRYISYREYITALHGPGFYKTWRERPVLKPDGPCDPALDYENW